MSLRLIKCVFVGYYRTQRGYRCFHPPIRWYSVSTDVTFFKSQSYFDGTTSVVECLLLPSVVESSITSGIDSPVVDKEMSCSLLAYRRREQIHPPSLTEPFSFADANQLPIGSDLSIALRKGTRSCTAHPIFNFILYDSLHPSIRNFALSISFESVRETVRRPS